MTIKFLSFVVHISCACSNAKKIKSQSSPLGRSVVWSGRMWAKARQGNFAMFLLDERMRNVEIFSRYFWLLHSLNHHDDNNNIPGLCANMADPIRVESRVGPGIRNLMQISVMVVVDVVVVVVA